VGGNLRLLGVGGGRGGGGGRQVWKGEEGNGLPGTGAPLQAVAERAHPVLCPIPSRRALAPQVWLQDFAWTQGGLEEKIAKRNALLRRHLTRLVREPMFCFETACRYVYSAQLVYEVDEVGGGEGSAPRWLRVRVSVSIRFWACV
jgi:hypothetical protein